MKKFSKHIRLKTEPGVVFDSLSVLEIKAHCSENKLDVENFNNQTAELKKQLGKRFFVKIWCSDIYEELYQINKELFKKIETLENSEYKDQSVTAEVLHKLNKLRFEKKKALQKKFFKSKLKERKI